MINKSRNLENKKTSSSDKAQPDDSLNHPASPDSFQSSDDNVSVNNQESPTNEGSATDLKQPQETLPEKPVEEPGNEMPENVITPDTQLPEIPEITSEIEEKTPDIQFRIDNLENLITSQFECLLKEFETKIKYDRFKETQITRLHNELQTYKSDLLTQAIRPFIRGIISLYDDISKITESLGQQEKHTDNLEPFFNSMEGFKDSIEILLNHNGIKKYQEPGDIYNPKRQIAVYTELTTNPDEVGKVIRHLRPGFEQGNTIIQLERVVVLALDKNIKTEETPAQSDKNEEEVTNSSEEIKTNGNKEGTNG